MVENVKRVILVLSGKGGVGKSTTAVQLALSLAILRGQRVGLLDIDICGPSVPRMLGLEGADVLAGERGWIPVQVPLSTPVDTSLTHEAQPRDGSLWVMSIGFLQSNRDAAVIWRGPKKNAMISQFVTGVEWPTADGQLDFLIVDTPPGTSDEHLSIVESLRSVGHPPDGAVLVTTPQGVAVADVRREVTFCRKVGVPMLGIVENMSGYVCPHCSECTNVFSKGGGTKLAAHAGIPFLAEIPIDPQLGASADRGDTTTYVTRFCDSQTCKRFAEVADKVLAAF